MREDVLEILDRLLSEERQTRLEQIPPPTWSGSGVSGGARPPTILRPELNPQGWNPPPLNTRMPSAVPWAVATAGAVAAAATAAYIAADQLIGWFKDVEIGCMVLPGDVAQTGERGRRTEGSAELKRFLDAMQAKGGLVWVQVLNRTASPPHEKWRKFPLLRLDFFSEEPEEMYEPPDEEFPPGYDFPPELLRVRYALLLKGKVTQGWWEIDGVEEQQISSADLPEVPGKPLMSHIVLLSLEKE